MPDVANQSPPLVGDIVLYTLSRDDAFKITRRRTSGRSIAERMEINEWPVGAQAHIGNQAAEGQEFPAVIVRVHDVAENHARFNAVNLQVLLDGTDIFWATDVFAGPDPSRGVPGTWRRR